jgi:hypothetical protein
MTTTAGTMISGSPAVSMLGPVSRAPQFTALSTLSELTARSVYSGVWVNRPRLNASLFTTRPSLWQHKRWSQPPVAPSSLTTLIKTRADGSLHSLSSASAQIE